MPGRQKLNKAQREEVWKRHIGMTAAEGPCSACQRTIHITDFEVGHDIAVAKGGTNAYSNLRPICGSCNRAMGTGSLEEYREQFHGPSIRSEDPPETAAPEPYTYVREDRKLALEDTDNGYELSHQDQPHSGTAVPPGEASSRTYHAGDPGADEQSSRLMGTAEVPDQPRIIVDHHRFDSRFGLTVLNEGQAARFKANASLRGPKISEGPFPLIWGWEAREGDSITLMKGETSFVLLGAWEYVPNHKTHRIDIWKHTGQRKPFKYHPAWWPDGSSPDDPVQIDIQILSDPPLVTPFQRSYVIRFDQQSGGGVVVE